MFVIDAETVIQKEGDAEAVIDTLVQTPVNIFQSVAHKIGLDSLHRVLLDREFITVEYSTPRASPAKSLLTSLFLVSRKFCYQPPPAEKVRLPGFQLSALPTICWL